MKQLYFTGAEIGSRAICLHLSPVYLYFTTILIATMPYLKGLFGIRMGMQCLREMFYFIMQPYEFCILLMKKKHYGMNYEGKSCGHHLYMLCWMQRALKYAMSCLPATAKKSGWPCFNINLETSNKAVANVRYSIYLSQT